MQEIKNAKVVNLTLKKSIDICKASENTQNISYSPCQRLLGRISLIPSNQQTLKPHIPRLQS
jgi:hypothetical protein